MANHILRNNLCSPEALRIFEPTLFLKWKEAFKDLLEGKHLYQKITINADELAAIVSQRMTTDAVQVLYFKEGVARLKAQRLYLRNTIIKDGAGTVQVKANVAIGNVKLFCTECDRSEAFRPLHVVDISTDITVEAMVANPANDKFNAVQVFLFVYQCQGCLGTPTTILVRREGLSLRVEGRSPIEHLEVPRFIPTREQTYYRDALIARNSGKTLAALFYLRTFIEQFARRVTGLKGRITGDEIMDKYAETIPIKHRESMPSLREWYDKLSEPIHDGKEDEECFETARTAIDEHFDIRRVFKIPEPAVEVRANTMPQGGASAK